MKLKTNSARSIALAISLSSLQPMLEGCANLPPVGNPRPDAGAVRDGGRGGGSAFDGGNKFPDAGGRPGCNSVSERLYVGGGPVSFDGELFILESSAGYSAQISISDIPSGSSSFVSVPEWGSQKITFAGKTLTIFVNETFDGSPSWADVDIYGC